MHSLTINPDRSAVYTEIKDGVQTTTLIPTTDFTSLMAQAPSGDSWWDGLDALIDAYIAAKV